MFGALWKWSDIEIEGISDNSQKIKPGFLFICRKGGEKSGYDYLAGAEENGAVAIVSEENAATDLPNIITDDIVKFGAYLAKRFYLPNENSFKLIGVTGTNGKTTVTHIIRDILMHLGKKTGMIGTNGVFIDNQSCNFKVSTPTTPNATELWEIFSEMKRAGAEYVIMEVSSHALALERVFGCEFDVGVFTNLTQDHLDFHKTMEEYKKAKAKLFDISKSAVINIDDIAGAEIFSKIKYPKISVGFGDADLTPGAVKMRESGSQFNLEYEGLRNGAELVLPGRFNIYNAMLSSAAVMALGFSLSDAAEGLSEARPVAGRMERISCPEGFSVIIDYAHSPDGLEKLIHTAKGFAKGRVITIFGCGGDRDREKRHIMGEISGKFSDYTIITSDNPRCEEPFSIIAGIYDGIKNTKGDYSIIPDRRKAIEHGIDMAKPGDIILLAGKGNEDYQIIGKEKFPFDERKIIKEITEKG